MVVVGGEVQYARPPPPPPQSLTRNFSKSKKSKKNLSPKSQIELWGGGGKRGIVRQTPHPHLKVWQEKFLSPKSQVEFRGGGGGGGSEHHFQPFLGHFTFERMNNVCLHISCDIKRMNSSKIRTGLWWTFTTEIVRYLFTFCCGFSNKTWTNLQFLIFEEFIHYFWWISAKK